MECDEADIMTFIGLIPKPPTILTPITFPSRITWRSWSDGTPIQWRDSRGGSPGGFFKNEARLLEKKLRENHRGGNIPTVRLVLAGRPSVLEEVRKFRERHHKLIRYIPFDAQILLEAPGLDPSSPSRITCVRRVACRGNKRRPRNGRREG